MTELVLATRAASMFTGKKFYLFVSHPKHVGMSCSKRIIIFCLRHRTSALLIDKGNRVLSRDAEFIGAVANELAIFCVQLRQIVRLSECQKLIYLPQIGHGCQEWSGKPSQGVEIHLIHDVACKP